MIATLLTMVLLANYVAAALNGHCPPLGAVLPAPTNPSACAAVQAAIYDFEKDFNNLTSSFDGSAVSVSVKSIHELNKMLDLHYTPPTRDPSSTGVVDANTIYRIASISKVFTTLGLLHKGIGMDDPVTKYIPDLPELVVAGEVNNITAVNWDDVTIGALASHMSGIGLDLMNDLADTPGNWMATGFPELHGSASSPGCSDMYGLPPCSTDELTRDFGKHHPVLPPFTSPTYSNLGFDILGLVLESASNMAFVDYIQQAILDPLNLTNTTTGMASSLLSQAFIPAQSTDQSHWGVQHGYDNPAGGFLSTPNDLITLGSAILNQSFLGPATTRKWMKPVSSTSTVGRDMGAPWEILRSTNLTTDGRLIELYTKGGDDGSYHSKLCLIPDYDLVVTIMTAGPEADFTFSFTLLSRLLSILLPAIEQAGKEEAILSVVGTYTDDSTSSGIALSVDDGPGLAISNWTVRGLDVMDLYAKISGISSVPVIPRLYPTNLQGGGQAAWRAVFDTGSAEQNAEFDSMFAWPGQSCQTWANMDRFAYGFNGIDEFLFAMEEQASGLAATGLANRGFQVDMSRQV
ncbi:Beta-lactamase-like protein 2 [Cytospora mali]|uniref:Beta-lactamase-like protein 2 n=1 Tax=Cytospora mali TaxID=578113 RepID=A0A194UTP2_CYTMA|nr:Beta-lactamase-like protein 2 [Valsa mali var. pyri (nom. inval.)]